jgi:hypothetical protein
VKKTNRKPKNPVEAKRKISCRESDTYKPNPQKKKNTYNPKIVNSEVAT